jgi:hypothetical protein
MDEDKIQGLIVAHNGGEAPSDIDEMVDAAVNLSGAFEEASDEEMQLGLDELVLEASSAVGGLATADTAEGDEQDDAFGDAESAASDINNQGIESQIAYVLVKYGLDEGVSKLREILGDMAPMAT